MTARDKSFFGSSLVATVCDLPGFPLPETAEVLLDLLVFERKCSPLWTDSLLVPNGKRFPKLAPRLPEIALRLPKLKLRLQRVRVPTSEARAPTSKARAPTSEARAPTSRVRAPTSRVRAPTSGVRVPTSEARVPTSEARAPTSEARAPTSEVGRPTLKVIFFNSLQKIPISRKALFFLRIPSQMSRFPTSPPQGS